MERYRLLPGRAVCLSKLVLVHLARLTLFVGLLALSRILKSYRHIFNFVEEEQKTRNNLKK